MSPYAIIAVLLALCYAVVTKARARSSNLPPSPPSLPLLGHLHLLGRLPHRSLRELHLRYGTDGGLLCLQLGRRRSLVVSTAAAAADLYKNHDLAFASRVPSAMVDKVSNGSTNVSFAPYGDAWRRRKKLAVVHLLSPRRADSFGPVRAAEVGALVAAARRAAESGEAVELRELLYGYSNAVVTRAAAGTAGATAEKIKQLMGNSAALITGLQPEDVLPDAAAKVVRWATGIDKRINGQVEAWDKFLNEIMAEHLEKKSDGGAGEEDFFDVLLRLREEGTAELDLTDDRIKAIVKDMIFAGTETSSVTLEWAMAELVGNSRAMIKLQDEITRVAIGKPTIEEVDLSKMEYLKAVLKEVLRLHPPAPLLVPHQSTTAAVVQGYEIPAKTTLFINAWAIGRDPAAWGDSAEEFRPERFLDSGSVKGIESGAVPGQRQREGHRSAGEGLPTPPFRRWPADLSCHQLRASGVRDRARQSRPPLRLGAPHRDVSRHERGARADHAATSSTAPHPQVQDTCLDSQSKFSISTMTFHHCPRSSKLGDLSYSYNVMYLFVDVPSTWHTGVAAEENKQVSDY